jgi:hypothetical protein
MYRRAFTDFDFIELPPSYKQWLNGRF